MNKKEKITISVNEEDVQNIINAYEKDIEYINQLEKENQRLKEIEKEHQRINGDLRVEMKELKRKLNEAIHKATEFESEVYELQKQLEEYENELGKADSIIQSCIFNGKKESEISYRKCLNMLEKRKNRQKEFIEYMNKTMEECNNYSKYIEKKTKELHGRSYGKTYIANEIMKNEVAKKILKETLSKYKSIIGE